MSFRGKVVLVTGASSGIGAATAIKFANEGAYVSLVGRNQEKLNKVSQKCGVNSHVIIADVSKDKDAERLVKETIDRFGQLDVLVNNAGISGMTLVEEDDHIRTFDRIMATNLRACVVITKLAVPHLEKTKGNIINISSIAALSTLVKGNFAYCTSKAALDHFTRAIAVELAPLGIRANTVNPGPVKTDIIANSGASELQTELSFRYMKKTTLLNRISGPEEVTDLILFLASNKAKAITASTYVTDNGSVMSLWPSF